MSGFAGKAYWTSTLCLFFTLRLQQILIKTTHYGHNVVRTGREECSDILSCSDTLISGDESSTDAVSCPDLPTSEETLSDSLLSLNCMTDDKRSPDVVSHLDLLKVVMRHLLIFPRIGICSLVVMGIL